MADEPSAVGEAPPARTALLGGFPNPFNPRTTIRYQVARETSVRLEIYDLAGRLVRRLVAGDVVEAGVHSVVWDGRDRRRQGVSAGTYLVLSACEGGQQAQGIMLVR